MSSPERPSRQAWKPANPSTFWGSHVESAVPPRLATVVLAVSAGAVVYCLAAEPFGLAIPPRALRGYLQLALPCLGALLLFLVAAFAWAAWRTRGGATALLLAGILPLAGLLSARHSMIAWMAESSLAPGAVTASWLVTRLLPAAGLQLAWLDPWVSRRLGGTTGERNLRAAGLLLLSTAAALAMVGTLEASAWLSAGDAVVLLLFILAVPAVTRLHRREPNLLTHVALLSLAPQAASQLAALASTSPGDTAAVIAQALAVLAWSTLLAGIVLDFTAIQEARQRMQGELLEAERGLQTRTLEVERINQELAHELAQKERYHRRLQLLDLAIQRMSLGLTITDTAGVIIYVNPADAVMHGYQPEELLGRSSRVYGAVLDISGGAAAAAPPPARPLTFWSRETLNRTKDGKVFPVRLISDTVPGEDGRPRALVTLCEDVSEVVRVREALAAHESEHEQLVEGASDLIQSVSPDGRFRLVNRAWLDALGYQPGDLEGLSIWDVIAPRHHAECQNVLRLILADGRPQRVETVFLRRSGAEIYVEGNVGVRREDGRITASIGIFRDVTERRRVERMKQDFLSTVSHELLTPLTSMLGALGLVRGSRLAASPQRIDELLEIAERNGSRLVSLVNDLLDMQRLEAGDLHFQLGRVSLGPLLDEAVSGVESLAAASGVQVCHEPCSAGITLVTDRERLGQVLYNLLSNAIKFSPRGEEVRLAAAPDGNEMEITVKDRGPGIPEEFRGRLFETFSQAEEAQTRRQGGSGLGLSISKKLVEGLGGTISVVSRQGEGTTARVRLPMRLPLS